MGRNLAVALAYLVLAGLSASLGEPPIHGPPVWLPAGFALLALLLWGMRVWAGVWLGAFAAGLIQHAGDASGAWIAGTALPPAVEATAALAQALLGAHLARPLLAQPSPLATVGQAASFLLMTGPLACLVSATVKLIALPALQNASLLATWAMWYSSDTLGVLLLAPLVLLGPASPADGRGKRLAAMACVLTGWMALLLAGESLFSRHELQSTHNAFERFANDYADLISRRLDLAEDRLLAIGSLFNASRAVSAAEFRVFNEGLRLLPGITARTWIPTDGAGERVEAAPHLLFAPDGSAEHGAAKALEMVARSAMARATTTGRRVLAPKSDQPSTRDWSLVVPIHARGSSPRSAKGGKASAPLRRELRGFAVARLDIHHLFADMAARARQDGIAFRVEYQSAGGPAIPVVEEDMPAQRPPDALRSLSERFGDDGLRLELWQLRHWQFGQSSDSLLFLSATILVTFLLGIFLLNAAGATLHLARLVRERTAEVEAGRERLAALVENLSDAVITIDEHGIVQSANPAVERIFGYAPDELLQRNVSLLMPAAIGSEHDGYLTRFLETGEAHVIGLGREVAGVHKNGESIPLHLAVSAYRVGERHYFAGALRDLRYEKRAMAEIQSARQEAESASAAKSNFLAAMSHEIRTPMNGVIGMIDVLSQTSLKGYQVEIVELVRDSANALLSIIEDILDFSKIEADKLTLEHDVMSIEAEVEKVCALLDHVAARKQVVLSLFVDPAIPQAVDGDALRLRQVLTNLVNNGVKFSGGQDRPGRVRVDARLVELRPHQAMVEFSVRDNGIGIDAAAITRLFQPFEQAEASTTRRFGGTGLGLAISRRLVEMMQGSIEVISTPGAGSTFTTRIPFALPTPALPQQPPLVGVSCLLIGPASELLEDAAAHLAHAGARLGRAAGIDEAAGCTTPEGEWIWLFDAQDGEAPLAQLRKAARAHGRASTAFLVIGRGRRRRPRRVDDELVQMDGNLLTRQRLLDAVAVALGRAAEEPAMETRGHAREGARPPSRAEAIRQRRLILVAEDNQTNQQVIERQLALLGFAAEVAGDGEDALARWEAGDYALLLTDLHMPRLDGYELTAAIRYEEARRARPRMPIVTLTANALQGEAEQCRAAGMDDYLSKPVRLDVLKATLEKWLPAITEAPPRLPGAEPTTAAGAGAPVNVAVLAALVGDGDDIIGEFLRDFRASATEIAARLEAACLAGCPAEAGAQAHKLMSAARSVGAARLDAVCALVEQAGRAEDRAALAELLPGFSAEMRAVEAYLDAWLSPKRGPADGRGGEQV